MDEDQQNQSIDNESQPMESDAPITNCPKCEEYLAGWKRAQADYQNVLRERDRDRTELVKFANERLLKDLLPALDQFSLAMRFVPSLETLPEDVRTSWERWLTGLKAVSSEWEKVATSLGLEKIACDGEFDPTVHEALSEQVSESVASGHIVQVIEDGWRLHGKVLRPAKVIVSK